MSSKYMKSFMIFVSVALVISLISHFNVLSKINELENRIQSMSNNQQNMANNINGQSNQIRQALNEFIEEQSWISRIDMNYELDTVDQGEVTLNFTWQVKELYSDSEVDFHYAYGLSEEFVSLSADEIEQGLFTASVPIEIHLEPQWSVNTHTVNERNPARRVEKDADIKAANQHSIKYFVSVTTDDQVKSGDIQTEHLGHLGSRYYGNIIAEIRLDEEYVIINLTNHRPDQESRWIKEVYLLTYDNNTLIGEQEIELDHLMDPDIPIQFIRSDQLERNVQMQHVIKVLYSDGKAFEKEISVE